MNEEQRAEHRQREREARQARWDLMTEEQRAEHRRREREAYQTLSGEEKQELIKQKRSKEKVCEVSHRGFLKSRETRPFFFSSSSSPVPIPTAPRTQIASTPLPIWMNTTYWTTRSVRTNFDGDALFAQANLASEPCDSDVIIERLTRSLTQI
ncbi:hypothetical protein BDY24DRAFT_373194 [Mrakia frigida]|uniref:uncharacterized protein n=1 Tax=Mrakia frigida TaxID=29902 RepID=UPI003FCC10B8